MLKILYASFETLTAVTFQVEVFWVVTQSSSGWRWR